MENNRQLLNSNVLYFIPFKATLRHGKDNEQQAMADSLIAFIETNYWKG